MHIEIDEKPNALGTYKYTVRDRGKMTYGYRASPTEARKAAAEDAALIGYGSGREEDQPEEPRRPRREP